MSDTVLNSGVIQDNIILEQQIEDLEIQEEADGEGDISDPGAVSGIFLSGQDLGNVCNVTAINLIQAGEYDKALPFLKKQLLSIQIRPRPGYTRVLSFIIKRNTKQPL